MSVHKTDKKEFPNVHRQSCGSKKRKSVFDIQHWQVHVVLVAPGGLKRQALCLVSSHLWLVPCCSLWGVEHSGHQQYLSKGQRYRALTLLFQEVSFWVLFGKQLTPLASEVDWAAPYVWHSTIWTYAFLRSQVRLTESLLLAFDWSPMLLSWPAPLVKQSQVSGQAHQSPDGVSICIYFLLTLLI